MTNPNESPYTPQVHNDPRSRQIIGMPEDQQRGLRGKFVESIISVVVKAITGTFLPGPVGTAVNQLADWFLVDLPELILNPIRDLVDWLIDILDLIPIIGPPASDILEYFASIFGLLRDTTAVAQQTADHANVSIADVEARLANDGVPGGLLYNDTFNYMQNPIAGDYVVHASGAAGGNVAADGANLHYFATGAGTGYREVHLPTILFTTNLQTGSIVQDTAMGNIVNPCELRIMLRCDAGRTNYVMAVIGWSAVAIHKVVAGTSTSLASVACSNSAGDRWTFRAGTDNDVREFVLHQNNDERLRIIDASGTLSQYGTGYDTPMVAFLSGQQFIPPFFTRIVDPPSMQSVNFYDRLAAA